MLTPAELTDARRFCGYPAQGADPAANAGMRFYPAFGALEYRLANLSPSEETVLRAQIETLRAMEGAIPAAAEGLDTAAAGPWTRNPDEVRDRVRLFDDWRRRLCAFLGLPPGPALAGTNTPGLRI